MTKDKMTPLQAARRYAAEHPEFEGEVDVTTLRPKGRGGRLGLTRQTNRVWVAGGRAALHKSLWNTDAGNGYCRSCGRVYTDPVLVQAYRRDERAGQPLSDADRAARAWTANEVCVYDAWCGAREICPTCVAALGLEPMPEPFTSFYKNGEPRPVICRPPEFVATAPRPQVVAIDLTGENE